MQGGNVLVVDDNEMNRDMLLRRLTRQGYEVVSAEDGKQALKVMGEQNFDLVLLDIMMPQMNGYEVLEHMKADPTMRKIPVIMISAVDDLDSVVKCIELGAEDYLFKPFNPVLLKARVEATLEKKHLRDQEGSIDVKYVQKLVDAIHTNTTKLHNGDGGALSESQTALVGQILRDTEQLVGLLKQ
jgi:adenylate cyclase